MLPVVGHSQPVPEPGTAAWCKGASPGAGVGPLPVLPASGFGDAGQGCKKLSFGSV